MKLVANHEGETFDVEIERLAGAGYQMRIGDRVVVFDLVRANPQMNSIRFENGTQYLFGHHAEGSKHAVSFSDQAVHVDLVDPLALRGRRSESDAIGGGMVKALMPGRIVRVLKKEGEQVRKGEGILILEAMKMQNEIAAPAEGIVTKILVSDGQTVEGGAELLQIEAAVAS
jgi:biotin carboxyl carrier protein